MNKKERVLAALENRETDHVPGGFWFHFPEEEAYGQACVDAHLKWYRDTDQDFIKIMCDGYFGYPNETLENLKEVSALYEMKPLGSGHPFIREQVERAAAIVRAVDGECCVFYNVFCPLSFFRLQVGWEKMMACMKRDPAAVMHACSVIAEDAEALVKGVIEEAGCDGIYYCVQSAETFRFTAEEYRKWVTPSDQEVLRFANGLSRHNILHCCGWGGDKNRLEVWQDYEAAAVNWAVYVEELDILAGREFFGGKAALGGFDNRKSGVLYSGSREEIQEFTKALIGTCGKKGFLLGADCTIPRELPAAHIRWALEAARSL